jgi:hypothetical protein
VQLPDTAPPPGAGEDEDVLSPELVMVDPELRDRLDSLPLPPRWLPPEPEPAPEPEAEPEPLPLRVAEPPPPPPEPELPPAARRRRRWPLLLVALVGLAAGGAAVAVFALGSNDDASPVVAPATSVSTTGHIGRPASSAPVTTVAPPPSTAPTTTAAAARTTTHRATATPPVATHTTPAQTTKPKPQTTAPKPPPASTKPKPAATPVTSHQKLAWAPAAGARAYDVELLRGAATVYVARTTQPSIVIAVTKGARPPAGAVSAGTYEWVVWPIVGGHRSAQAIVRSQLHLAG